MLRPQGLRAQTTWRGSISTDWNTAGNRTFGVPTAANRGLRTWVHSKMKREVKLRSTGAEGAGLLNNGGTFTNAGNIALGAIANDAYCVLMNAATFENELGGEGPDGAV